MSQTYEYSYASSTGGLGSGVTGYTVTSNEYTSVTGGDVIVSSGGSSLSNTAAQILIGSIGSGSAAQSSGAAAQSSGTASQIYQIGSIGSSGSAAQLSGGAVQLSGGAAQSSGTVSQIAQDLLALGGAGGNAIYGTGGIISSGIVSSTLEASAFSAVEQAILQANNPIAINETEVITVNGQSGVWANKQEIVNWRGVIPITQYIINEDSNPEIIRKRTEQQLLYEQEIAIRYLRPPTPPPPGEILIRQEKNIPTPPAPPLVIRQQPPRPETPAPLVIREAPPKPPSAVGAKVITISGKRLPPPPRKVIIERLAPLPSKPQSVIIERWLPYNQNKRRVIFQRNTVPDPIVAAPRNVIVQWEAPSVTIKKEFKDLGVIRANPSEYVQRYGATLKTHIELPSFVKEIKPPSGVVLAAEYVAPSLYELEGDVQALSLIDLEREGLAEYRAYLARFGFSANSTFSSGVQYNSSFSASSGGLSGAVGGAIAINSLIAELFASVDRNSSGKISLNEAEKLLLKLNSRLGRRYGEDEARIFFRSLDTNADGFIDFEEFRRALLKEFS